jgi:hypothetical protein
MLHLVGDDENDISCLNKLFDFILYWKKLFISFRALIVGQFCKNYLYFVLISWLPTYFHDNYPHAKVGPPISNDNWLSFF